MSKKNKHNMKNEEPQVKVEADKDNVQQEPQIEVNNDENDDNSADNVEVVAEPEQQSIEEQLEQQKKEYLFLMAEFDNFRKRTLQEKQELIKNGASRAMEQLLPVVDDVERALSAIEQAGDIDSMKEGINLIHNKFLKYLKQQNVEPIESTGQLFDTDLHEAVTTFPTPDEEMKGKVIDTVLKGYKINDKVLRHAKVVVGA